MEHSRVCARIDLDAVGANLESMRQKLKKETRIIAVIKTNAYGHGAVQIARMVQEYAYLWDSLSLLWRKRCSLERQASGSPS